MMFSKLGDIKYFLMMHNNDGYLVLYKGFYTVLRR